jgi:hypothetical protein
MSDVMFLMGLAAGSIIGAAIVIWLTERKIDEEVHHWEDLLTEQQGHIAELRPATDAPKAVTKLTSRERTVEL